MTFPFHILRSHCHTIYDKFELRLAAVRIFKLSGPYYRIFIKRIKLWQTSASNW